MVLFSVIHTICVYNIVCNEYVYILLLQDKPLVGLVLFVIYVIVIIFDLIHLMIGLFFYR